MWQMHFCWKGACLSLIHIFKASFHGYMPECGDPELRRTIAGYYKKRNADLSPEEVFISSGASDELGDILDLFGRDKKVMIMEPAYPAYVDANIIAGNTIRCV